MTVGSVYCARPVPQHATGVVESGHEAKELRHRAHAEMDTVLTDLDKEMKTLQVVNIEAW